MSDPKKTTFPPASASGAPSETDASTLGYEAALAELETIIARIERGDGALDESLRQYRRGATLVKRCRDVLDQARAEVERIAVSDLAERAESASKQPDA